MTRPGRLPVALIHENHLLLWKLSFPYWLFWGSYLIIYFNWLVVFLQFLRRILPWTQELPRSRYTAIPPLQFLPQHHFSSDFLQLIKAYNYWVLWAEVNRVLNWGPSSKRRLKQGLHFCLLKGLREFQSFDIDEESVISPIGLWRWLTSTSERYFKNNPSNRYLSIIGAPPAEVAKSNAKNFQP